MQIKDECPRLARRSGGQDVEIGVMTSPPARDALSPVGYPASGDADGNKHAMVRDREIGGERRLSQAARNGVTFSPLATGVEAQNPCHAIISARRFSSASERRYAAST